MERRGMGASEATEMRAIDMHLFLQCFASFGRRGFRRFARHRRSGLVFVALPSSAPEPFSRQLAWALKAAEDLRVPVSSQTRPIQQSGHLFRLARANGVRFAVPRRVKQPLSLSRCRRPRERTRSLRRTSRRPVVLLGGLFRILPTRRRMGRSASCSVWASIGIPSRKRSALSVRASSVRSPGC